MILGEVSFSTSSNKVASSSSALKRIGDLVPAVDEGLEGEPVEEGLEGEPVEETDEPVEARRTAAAALSRRLDLLIGGECDSWDGGKSGGKGEEEEEKKRKRRRRNEEKWRKKRRRR